jgi:hypothetical protein
MTYASWQSFDTKCTKNPATLPARGGPSQKRFDQEWRRRPSQRRARKGEDFERQFTTPVVTLHARILGLPAPEFSSLKRIILRRHNGTAASAARFFLTTLIASFALDNCRTIWFDARGDQSSCVLGSFQRWPPGTILTACGRSNPAELFELGDDVTSERILLARLLSTQSESGRV